MQCDLVRNQTRVFLSCLICVATQVMSRSKIKKKYHVDAIVQLQVHRIISGTNKQQLHL